MGDSFLVIGLMSGTSLDGLDLAYCRFKKNNGNWQFELLASESTGYNNEWLGNLKNAIHLSE